MNASPSIRSDWESGHPEQTRFGQGGTKQTEWTCVNGHDNRHFAIRCLTLGCGEKRPK